jgi:hypothetical protein
MFNITSYRPLALIAAAGLASVALATSASASPTDSLTIDTSGHTASFGTSCAAGAAPASAATADWQQNTGNDTVALSVSGDLCLQKTKDTYRVEARYYYEDPASTHFLIATVDSRATTGNNGALNTSSVNLQLPRVNNTNVHHAHIVIQKQDPATGAWSDYSFFTALDS